MWIYKHKSHKKIKTKLLKLIDEMPNEDIKEGDNISKTDWNIPKEFKRKYLDFFYESFRDQMNKISSDFNCSGWEIHNGWYQQYSKNDKHRWHNHAYSSLAAVYYLELPNKNLQTKFIDGSKPKVKEGDVLFFPSYLLHTSPINKSNNRKTVIAFNCCFFNWDGKNDI